MPAGELVFANVLDVRVRDGQGEGVDGFLYLLAFPARALPFAVVRDWKAPTGYLLEEVQLIAPSGTVTYRIGPQPRWMLGSMDLTRVDEVIEDAFFEELGTYVASFLLDGEVLGQTEFQVVVQAAPQKFTSEVEDGLKKADVVWIGVEYDGKDIAIPAWFVYRQGRMYVLSSTEPSLEEQTIPGLPEAKDLLVITRQKYRDTALGRFHAAARILEGPEWDQAAALLADRRRDRHGPPEEAIKRWRDTCVIAELTPVVPA
jgi:hypothetical protein